MRGRETNKGAPSADLLACFPSRAHLTLMPKPICSPARPSEPNKRRRHHHHHLRKSSTRGDGGGQASPLLWVKNKQMGSEISEPTSPKVTCAGQIKVRPKTSSCKSWQSVMEEIERIHNSRQLKKRPSWVESLGFKKEIMHFLTCLRSIRFDFRCFGAFPQTDITSTDDEDGDYEEEEEDDHVGVGDDASSRTVFSKWFMVLQENQSTNNGFCKEERKEKEKPCFDDEDHSVCEPSTAPPPNALLLMRCRSAPAKSWLEEKEEKEEIKEDDDHEEDRKKDEKKKKDLRSLMEEDKRKKKENLVVMRYDTDFYKISSDIAKETWVNVGGMNDLLSRSRSWKR